MSKPHRRRIAAQPGDVWVTLTDDGHGLRVLFVRAVHSGGRKGPPVCRRGSRWDWVLGIERSAWRDGEAGYTPEQLRRDWRRCTDEEAAAARRGLWPVVVDLAERGRRVGAELDPDPWEELGYPWPRRQDRRPKYNRPRGRRGRQR